MENQNLAKFFPAVPGSGSSGQNFPTTAPSIGEMRQELDSEAVSAVTNLVTQVDISCSVLYSNITNENMITTSEDLNLSVASTSAHTEESPDSTSVAALTGSQNSVVLELPTSSSRTRSSRAFFLESPEQTLSFSRHRETTGAEDMEIEQRLAALSPTHQQEVLDEATRRYEIRHRICHLCDNQLIEGFINCRGYHCNKSIRYCCAEVDSRTVRNVDVFFCIDCQRKYKVNTIYFTDPEKFDEGIDMVNNDEIASNDSETEEERDYEVESIKAHFIKTKNKRFFLVKWIGYRKPTWVQEANLEGCLMLLNKYCLLAKIALSKIAPLDRRNGAVAESGFNPDNWVETERILATLKMFSNLKEYKTGIKVEEFHTLRKKIVDTIYILSLYNHTYVVVHLPSRNKCFVADGTNTYLDSEVHRTVIDSLLKVEITGIRFKQQKTNRLLCQQCGCDYSRVHETLQNYGLA